MGIVTGFVFTSDTETVTRTKLNSLVANLLTEFNGNIDNANVKAAAGIVYTKLNLSNSVVNADINSSAAIAYSKLNLGLSVVNADISATAAIAYSKLNLASSLLVTDIASTAYASEAEAKAGTENTKLMTPLTTMQAILDRVYPIGTVVTLSVSTNPATLYGIGTWTAIAGKVIVGIDASQTEFDTLNETGGNKTVSTSHTHSIPYNGWSNASGNNEGLLYRTSGGGDSLVTTANRTSGSGGDEISVLSPYIVKYVWERTA
jgi:hypothetical protein